MCDLPEDYKVIMCDLPEDYKVIMYDLPGDYAVIMCDLMTVGERGEPACQLLLPSGGGAATGT